ncbi:MAG: hypothetical protein Salg2KO_22600 [Salibacteraceae bacterium]
MSSPDLMREFEAFQAFSAFLKQAEFLKMLDEATLNHLRIISLRFGERLVQLVDNKLEQL